MFVYRVSCSFLHDQAAVPLVCGAAAGWFLIVVGFGVGSNENRFTL